MTNRKLQSNYKEPGDSPGFLLWQLGNVWQRHHQGVLKEIGLTHVQFVLLASLTWLSQDQENITQTQLSQYTAIDLMMTSQVLRTLETKELVERNQHPTDSRAKCLKATKKGIDLAKNAIILVEQSDKTFFSKLGSRLPNAIKDWQELIKQNI